MIQFYEFTQNNIDVESLLKYIINMNKQIPKNIHSALVKKYEAEADIAKANLSVYDNNIVGIGEHQIIAETIEEEYKKLDSAISMLETLKNNPIGV